MPFLKKKIEEPPKVSAKAVEVPETPEQKKAAMMKEMEEASRKAREERDREIRKTAIEYVANGRIRATVNGNRVEAIGEDSCLGCPECGGALRESADVIRYLTELYLFTPAQNKFADGRGLVIYDARNPLSWRIGFPGYVRALPCGNCGKVANVVLQLVVV